MALPLLIRQEMMAQEQLGEWSEQMMATAPISRWIDNLNHLFEVWHDEYGVRFTDESYDEILLWMAGRQQAAWAALGDDGSSGRSTESDLVQLNLDTLEVFDPKAGRQIPHEELKELAEEQQAAPAPPSEPETELSEAQLEEFFTSEPAPLEEQERAIEIAGELLDLEEGLQGLSESDRAGSLGEELRARQQALVTQFYEAALDDVIIEHFFGAGELRPFRGIGLKGLWSSFGKRGLNAD